MRLGARLLACWVIVALAQSPAHADWLSKLVALGEKAGSSAARTGARALDDAAVAVKALPLKPKTGVLAASVGHEGHWTFVNRAGETYTAANAGEMKRLLSVLAPEAAGAEGRLVFVLAEAAAFLHRTRLADLPAGAELRLAVGKTSYPLTRSTDANATRLIAQVRPNVVVELAERAAFDEALWHLARPLAAARIRVLSLEPGGPQTLPRTARLDPATARPMTDAIDPFKLAAALPAVRGQTAILSGRIEGELLHFRPSSGPERSVLWKDLTAAARDADVNLIALHSATPRQPGTRNWLWQRIDVAGLDQALQRATFGDFLDAIGAGQGRMLVTAGSESAGRVTIKALPVKGSSAQPVGSGISSILSDVVSEITGRVTSAAIEADVRSAARDRELDSRLIPGIPSDLQFAYLGALLLGLIGLPVARRWWLRVWPPEQREDYRGAIGYHAARATKFVIFLLGFMPIVSPLSAPIALVTSLWAQLTAPFRWIAHRLKRVRA